MANLSRLHLRLALTFVVIATSSARLDAEGYDLVLRGGRVIDPESGLDGVRDVGIRDGRVAAVTTEAITGAEVVDVSGKVVAPGFIDLHSHGAFSPANHFYQLHDGVTTALDLEAGALDVPVAAANLEGRALINFGASAGYMAARFRVLDEGVRPRLSANSGTQAQQPRAIGAAASDHEIDAILDLLGIEVDRGALGVGFLLDYMAEGIDRREVLRLFEFVARRHLIVFVHLRRSIESGDPSGLEEVISAAKETGTAVHVCHLTSAATRNIAGFLTLIANARRQGIDITTEAYPYSAGSTSIGSAVFGRDWQHTFGTTYTDIEYTVTGERLTADRFAELRASRPEAIVIHHYNREEFVRPAIAAEGVMVASDAMYMESMETRTHPRSAGTFSRVLGRYVRDEKLLTLPEAIAKMTLLPARRLERLTPQAKRKGRLQTSMDADIVVFDSATIADRATYEDPLQASSGIVHVLIRGGFALRDGDVVEGAAQGRWLRTEPSTFTGEPPPAGISTPRSTSDP